MPRLAATAVPGEVEVLMPAQTVTAQCVIDRIKQRLGSAWEEPTVDRVVAGDPAAPVRGIVTTMFPSMSVLRTAAERGANLVIPHEPTFYHGQEDTRELEGDGLLAAKRELITRHGLVIWRFHDHIHRLRPDGINQGMLEAMGWQSRVVGPADGYQLRIEIAPTTLGELAAALKQRLAARCIRVVGDPALRCARIGFAAGAPYSITQIKLLAADDVDVLVAGETREWETAEYTRDAVAAGRAKGLILLGHVISEESGMRWAARWIGDLVPEAPVSFVPSGEPFWAP
jgi:putative NIF3 family GTP cyclohydrolase 1 type 2